jgi:hypothetical protein
LLHFPDPAEATGLYDSSAWSGSGFYDRRFTGNQYGGVLGGYSEIQASPSHLSSTIQLETISAYYTIYPVKGLSLSASGGPEHYEISGTAQPGSSAWGPSWMGSAGWQGMRTNFAASYSRAVTGGGGLLGAYRTSAATGTFRWRVSRTWSANLGAGYYENKSVTSLVSLSTGSGHSLTGNVRLGHTFSDHINATFGYDHVHESYADIESVALNPDSNRESVSVSWQFTRPVGQ